MQYIECPNLEPPRHENVFLSGGIVDCPDWQSEVVNKLKDINITIFNPRRKNFPIHDPNASFEQIKWEFNKLRDADILSFWFSRGSLNPIVLFEYGSALERDKKIVIGIDPDYERRLDVEIQTSLISPHLMITHSIDELAEKIVQCTIFKYQVR